MELPKILVDLEQLKKTAEELLTGFARFELQVQKMAGEIDALYHKELRMLGLHKFCQLTEDIEIEPYYMNGRGAKKEKFTAGTLIDAEIRHGIARVYLDDDGDGWLNFPAKVLREVILDADGVDWDDVICQG